MTHTFQQKAKSHIQKWNFLPHTDAIQQEARKLEGKSSGTQALNRP